MQAGGLVVPSCPLCRRGFDLAEFGDGRSAQDASLLLVPPLAPKQKGPLTLENSSFMYRKLPPEAEQRELQLNDIITVLVDYRSSMLSEGDAEQQAKRPASTRCSPTG